MSLPPARRSRTWSVLALAALACLPRASAAAESSEPRTASAVEDLSQGAGRPDDFKRFIEGSRERRGDVDAPDVLARGGERGPGAALRLSRPEQALRPEGAVVPPAAVPAARRGEAPERDAWTPDLKTRQLAAALGLGLMLIAGSWLQTPRETEPDAASEAPESPLPARSPSPEPFRPSEPAWEPSRFAEALAEPDYIDTRMPAPTWRAISWREQSLIEAWDASPEKSSGAASLSEWLDGHGADGVDVPLLKAKLFRDA